MNAFCILFSDSYKDSHISELSNVRTLASIPFGGRYRLIDFILSSLVKSNIYNIGIVTKNKYGSLMDHLGFGKDWDLDRKNGGLKILTPFAQDASIRFSNSKIEALTSIRSYLESAKEEYCILGDCNVVFNIDFENVIECHEEKNADITILYRNAKETQNSMAIECDPNGRVTGTRFIVNDSDNFTDMALGVYVLKKELLLKIIDGSTPYGLQDLEREIISRNIEDMNIYAYKHIGYSSVITTVEGYYKTNMDLLDKKIRDELFYGGTTILTKVMDSTPTIYQENGKVKNGLIADGCVINGTVENSIIFRGVVVQKDAYIKDSIIMQGTIVGEGARLENVICDKQVQIGKGIDIKGSKKYPFVIEKMKSIKEEV